MDNSKIFLNNWMKRKIQSAKHHQNIAYNDVNELVFSEREKRILTLSDGSKVLEFVSCSYLGLDIDPRVINAANTSIKKCGVTFPAARTRIKACSFSELEERLNMIFNGGKCVIFSSLHVGHLGSLPLISSGEMPSFPISKNGPIFIVDKTVHASIQIQRALLEQFGQVIFLDYNNKEEIEYQFLKAEKEERTPIGIADSVGSMGGLAPVEFLMGLAEKYNGYIYLDDAHGTSIHGKNGSGYVMYILRNIFHPRLILAASLSKAFGTVGGVIVFPTREDVEMMKKYSPTYVFSGPPPLSIIDSAIASANIHLSDEIIDLQNRLWENVNYFDVLFEKNNIVNKGHLSPIRGLKIGDELNAIKYTNRLRKLGFAVTVAMYPTVSKNNSILRISLSSINTKEDIYNLSSAINLVMEK